MSQPRALPTRAAGCPTRDLFERALELLTALPVDEPSPAPRRSLRAVPDLPRDDDIAAPDSLGDAA